MIMVCVSIKDRAADAFGRPAFVASLGVAVRSFTDEVNREGADNQMYAHPDDFDLYDIGTFDDATCVFELHDFPKVIARGKDVKIRSVSELRAVA